MQAQLIERVEQLDDYMAIRIIEDLSRRFFEGMETPLEDMLNGVIPEMKNTPFFQQALTLSEEEQSRPLAERKSAEVARALLLYFAQDPGLSPVLARSLDEYKDDRLIVGTILATGVAVSMIIVAGTTRFEYKDGKLTFSKETVDWDKLGPLFKLFSGLLVPKG